MYILACYYHLQICGNATSLAGMCIVQVLTLGKKILLFRKVVKYLYSLITAIQLPTCGYSLVSQVCNVNVKLLTSGLLPLMLTLLLLLTVQRLAANKALLTQR